jgi:nucleotide-binding universal stress UspA family protein
MFNSILVPIDLADTDLAKPAIATAATLSKTWSGAVRLLNVLPMTPVMLAEYVPADFDTQQRQTSEEALTIVARESGIDAPRIFQRGAAGRHLSRDPGRSRGCKGRPDRDDIAPAGDADLFPRLQRRPRRALR